MPSAVRVATGQTNFIQGVDSGKVTTIADIENPDGLKPTQLAWMINATCRGGGVRCRTGWTKFFEGFADDGGLFQGGILYDPGVGAYPHFIFVANGFVYRLTVQPTVALTNLTVLFGANPGVAQFPSGLAEKCYFCQGEEFLVIQAGDFLWAATPPLVWDGTALYSINDVAHWGAGPMLPAGGPMDYYQDHFWVVNGQRTYMGGDIIYGVHGTLGYQFRDSILHAAENTILNGGGSFYVPSKSGNIRALAHTANLDSALGQSNLFIGTRNTIYSMSVPATRADWVAVSANKQLQRTIAQQRYGIVSDRSVVANNGDLFFYAYDGIRSLYLAIRYFQQWGQTAISSNIRRAVDYNDRALIHMTSGIEFDNRLLQTILPISTLTGTAFQAIAALDFDLLTSLEERKPPAWEGVHEGLLIHQLLEADFGGRQRAFAFVHSQSTGKIQIWELTDALKFENGDNRITWMVETPSYTWSKPWECKKLDNLILWLDSIFGTVDLDVYFRPDQDPCWHYWNHKQLCAGRSCRESLPRSASPLPSVCNYIDQPFCAQDRIPVVFPVAPGFDCHNGENRPVNFGYQFQLRIVVTGWCRLRGIQLYQVPAEKPPYEGVNS